jgi:hypothetical protein
MAGRARRSTHRSSTGTKLYAVHDAKGRFTDIQAYKRAHGSDIQWKAQGHSPDSHPDSEVGLPSQPSSGHFRQPPRRKPDLARNRAAHGVRLRHAA